MYWQAITVLEAENLLVATRVSDYPYMKAGDRSKFYNEINKLAKPAGVYNSGGDAITLGEFAKRLAGGALGG